jgi:hypothetical protein
MPRTIVAKTSIGPAVASVFTDEVVDAALEAAALGQTITFTSWIILFACRFC